MEGSLWAHIDKLWIVYMKGILQVIDFTTFDSPSSKLFLLCVLFNKSCMSILKVIFQFGSPRQILGFLVV